MNKLTINRRQLCLRYIKRKRKFKRPNLILSETKVSVKLMFCFLGAIFKY